MHMQVRTSLGKASATHDGPGAMPAVSTEVDPLDLKVGALAELLELLARNDYDLSMAGGDSIEGGGEFVFALKDDDRIGECAALLQAEGYRNVRILEPQHYELDDRKGALAEIIRDLVKDGRRIDEVYVGTGSGGKVPVQVTTIRSAS